MFDSHLKDHNHQGAPREVGTPGFEEEGGLGRQRKQPGGGRGGRGGDSRVESCYFKALKRPVKPL